jgi:hypothetical protein
MNMSPCAPTIRSLRRDLDRHYAATVESRDHVSNGLVGVIFSCLPPDMFNCIFLPADGARGPHLAITFKPAFRRFSQKGLVTSGFYLLLLSSRREPGYAIPMP